MWAGSGVRQDLRVMERVLADAVRRYDAGEAPGCPLIETLSKAEGIGRLIPSSNRGRGTYLGQLRRPINPVIA
jgi:hypothetical protein